MTLEELARVAEAHAEATGWARAAGEARARAAFDAREAGATLGQLARTLKVSRPAALELVRRGAQIVAPPADTC